MKTETKNDRVTLRLTPGELRIILRRFFAVGTTKDKKIAEFSKLDVELVLSDGENLIIEHEGVIRYEKH